MDSSAASPTPTQPRPQTINTLNKKAYSAKVYCSILIMLIMLMQFKQITMFILCLFSELIYDVSIEEYEL